MHQLSMEFLVKYAVRALHLIKAEEPKTVASKWRRCGPGDAAVKREEVNSDHTDKHPSHLIDRVP